MVAANGIVGLRFVWSRFRVGGSWEGVPLASRPSAVCLPARAKRKGQPHQCEEGNKRYLHGLKSSATALKIHRCTAMTMQFHDLLMYFQAYIYVSQVSLDI